MYNYRVNKTKKLGYAKSGAFPSFATRGMWALHSNFMWYNFSLHASQNGDSREDLDPIDVQLENVTAVVGGPATQPPSLVLPRHLLLSGGIN